MSANTQKEDLAAKAGIITGAASGIGRATALNLAAAGAGLLLADMALEPLQELAAEIKEAGGKEPVTLKVDVSDQGQVRDMVLKAKESFGSVDFMVNSAGILRRTGFTEIPAEEWDLMLAVNLTGVFYCCQEAAKVMVEQKSGSIVNVSSLAGRSTSILGGAHYTTVKHGVVGLSRHAARELGPNGIRVNAFCPGATITPMTETSAQKEERDRASAATPLRRWAKPEEQASVIAFLVSDASSFMTGACLDSNGGALMV
ncbi:SDR family NAD(P)-dependent oxidoreductase [Dethiosulfatarculus sandiegensis]|uniref:SDR family NAD(P)-dependent oxidoreductase n=1 Tax=Dethiosulfatarculus sandiegensis TaxID=1429043 RepID=UPI0005CA8AA5|nr:SDR family NAD(P)-dependent oxidoreductase [Dethiosulfatarculus sandiegensis]